jgi:hypothetical protein
LLSFCLPGKFISSAFKKKQEAFLIHKWQRPAENKHREVGFKWLNAKQKEMLLKSIQKHRIEIRMSLNSQLNLPGEKTQANSPIEIPSKAERAGYDEAETGA